MKKRLLSALLIASMCALTACSIRVNAPTESVDKEQAADKEESEPIEETEKTEEEIEDKAEAIKPGVYQLEYQEELEGEEYTYYSYIVLKDDGTGIFSVQDTVDITWDDSKISTNYNTYDYTVSDNGLILKTEYGDDEYLLLKDTDIDEFLENIGNPEYMFGIEEMSKIPNSFVEEAAGVTSFSSYDEVISNLTKDQGYAYIQMLGYDGDLLAITDFTYNDQGKNLAIDAVIYADIDGEVRYVTAACSDGTARPISVKDGVLLSATQHSITGDVFTPDGNAVMAKFYAYEEFSADDKGDYQATYGGFYRQENNFDEANESEIETEEEYQELWKIFLDADGIDFTLVE